MHDILILIQCGREAASKSQPPDARPANRLVNSSGPPKTHVQKTHSLADYATKRFRLAGKAYLDLGDPFFAPIDTLRREAELNGRRFVSFANYDYLGLASHPVVKAAAAVALEKFGIGALGSASSEASAPRIAVWRPASPNSSESRTL